MEHMIRVINEKDRRTLVWLRSLFDEATLKAAITDIANGSKPYVSAVCRKLGVRPPVFTAAKQRFEGTAAGNAALAAMKVLLAAEPSAGKGGAARGLRVG